jgi:hypothetical protein
MQLIAIMIMVIDIISAIINDISIRDYDNYTKETYNTTNV